MTRETVIPPPIDDDIEYEREFITKQIQQWEKTYNTTFIRTDEVFFPEEEVITYEDEPVQLSTDNSNVRDRSTMPAAAVELSSDEFSIEDTKVDSDGVLHYESNHTNTDDYVEGVK